ncbi:MAG: DUF3810 domain-containing protein [Lachnospiraceae bacterium]|nr:DUF3810 domain-containing protein [Lachnospiraceae bacterium]
MKSDTLKRVFLRKRTLILILPVLGLILMGIAKKSSYFTEMIFARHIFKLLSQAIALITGIFPFSVAEVMIILCPFLVIALIIGFIVKLVKNRHDWMLWVLTFILNAACMAGVVYFFYAFGCGANYYRYQVADIVGLKITESTKEELYGLTIELADKATELRDQITTEDEEGAYVLPYSDRQLAKEAKKAFKALGKKNSVFAGLYPAPKSVMLSKMMSKTEITGIYTCWTMEANVDVDIPDYSIGSTMCHELSHLRGFIREDEANYISYLACLEGDVDLQYSGVMLALIYTGNALAGKDSDLYADAWYNHYSPEVRVDLIKGSEYWKQFENTKVSEVTEQLNDTYLKANDQEDGTESYGRVVDLLLAEYKQRNN